MFTKKSSKLRTKIIFLLLVCIFSMSILSFYVLSRSTSVYDSIILNQTKTILELYANNFEKALDTYEQLSYNILIDKTLQNHLSSINNDPYQDYLRKELISQQLLYFMQLHKHISSINLIDNKNTIHTSGLSLDDLNIEFLSIKSNRLKGKAFWTVLDNHPDKLFLIRDVRDVNGLQYDKIGLLIIAINLDPLSKDTLINETEKQSITLIRQGTKVIYPVKSNFNNSYRLSEYSDSEIQIISHQDIDYLSVNIKNPQNRFEYIQLIPYSYVFSSLTQLKQQIFFFIASITLATIILGIIYSRTISKPLELLCTTMKKVTENNFKLPSNIHSADQTSKEVAFLYHEFILLIHELDGLVNEKFKTQLVLIETKYKMLQSQINPHFLYNTLDSINWMARLNKQPEIAKMIKALAHIMRESIDTSSDKTSVENELQLIEEYMLIQKVRFEDRLIYHFFYDPQVFHCLIPKLLIQPLIENSIQHALSFSEDPCTITLTIRKKYNALVIIVSDNGIGMNPHNLEALRNDKLPPKGNGIGIKNIKERLELLYQENFNFTIDSIYKQGTTITITFPLESEVSSQCIMS